MAAQSNGIVEYIDCISAEGWNPNTTTNECPGYDTKQSYGETLVLELWEICSTSSLPLLPGLLKPRVVILYKVL